MTDIELTEKIKKKAIELGAGKVGIGEADRCDRTPFFYTSPYTIMKDAKSLISICIPYPKGSLDIPTDDPYVFVSTFGNIKNTLHNKLREISIGVINLLNKNGYKGVSIDPVIPIDERRWMACMLSHSYAGMMSGLGDIGMNGMLLTSEFGCKIELITLFTDAPLDYDSIIGGTIFNGFCKECKKCVEVCPAQAIDSMKKPPYTIDLNRHLWGIQGWIDLSKIEVPPEDWINAKPTVDTVIPKYRGRYPKIKEYDKWRDEYDDVPFCLKCITVCPYGEK
ncbi:MAG: hypothetical protein EF806_04945 [Candidatus Methanoliparum thermophilum]|uniref:4Fe-4S ferredoxin-type domain-containing protein n=1 Tax=Methanoliparum thermophilum TaxID=2491083 RepID=A0A520KSJ3_METT2|nr:MAG: hypothetical protein EF806_04945 [Candidatus Methanoliparum thermophilum]